MGSPSKMSRINKLVKSMRIKAELSVLWPGQGRWMYPKSIHTHRKGEREQLCCGLVPELKLLLYHKM